MNDTYLFLLRSALLERGVLVDENGSMHLDPTHRGTDMPTQIQIDYLNQIRATRAAYSQMQLSWATDLLSTLRRIITGASTDPTALRVVLFLRLHGLLVEFPGHWQVASTALAGDTPNDSSDGAAFLAVLEAIEMMRTALTEDELLYIEYRRHVDAHIWQGAYDLQWNKARNAVQDQFQSKATGKGYLREDVDRRLGGVIRGFGSEAAVAASIAKRLEPTADSLVKAMTAFCAPSH